MTFWPTGERGDDHVVLPAGSCRRCDHAAQQAHGFDDRTTHFEHWWCEVHGSVGCVTQNDASLTIRSSVTPSATVTAWLDAVATQVSERVGSPILLTGRSLANWRGLRPLTVDEATAVLFATYGLSRAQMEFFLGKGITHAVRAQQWHHLDIPIDDSPEGVGGWLAAGITDVRAARAWMAAGVNDPAVAARFDTPTQHLFTEVAKVPAAREWGEIASTVAPQFARLGHQRGQSPAAVVALGRAMARARMGRSGTQERWTLGFGRTYVSPWNSDERARRVKVADGLAPSVDWTDVADCLDAGMTIGEAHAHVLRGQDMDPVRLLAALNR